MKRVGMHTLGCKLNFTETSALGKLLKESNYQLVPFEEEADLYLLNTCSVTENADKKCRHFIRRAKARNPESQVVIVGCYAQLKPKEISEIPGVDLVLGAAEKFRLIEHLDQLSDSDDGKYISSDVCNADTFINAWSSDERTRAFLKVQDGCDYSCSFCTIPLARGNSRSNTIEGVLRDVEAIAQEGKKEIVLTGVNLGDFGKGQHGAKKGTETFFDLIQELDKAEGIERFRISSIEPNLLSDEIIRFVAKSNKFVPHFHVPMQSGADELLGKMKRRYKRDLYTSRVQLIKELMPHCCIGVDVIVGFPGETEELFLETYRYLNELPISYLHVFSYSERKNTLAADMPNVVSKEDRKKRSKMLRILSDKKKRAFYSEHLGEIRPVLIEKIEETGQLTGFTDNYIKVSSSISFSVNELQENELVDFQLNEVSPDGLCIAKQATLTPIGD